MKLDKLVIELLSQSYLTDKKIASLKRKWAKKNLLFLKNSQILSTYRYLVRTQKIKPKKSLEDILRLKKIRSLSGIVPVAVVTKPYQCPGKCIYCPTQANIPKSYLDDEPAILRAKRLNFDPYLQVFLRLKQLKEIGHTIDKIELIVLGGTFSVLPWNYQKNFIKRCFDAVNKHTAKTLAQAQKINETGKHRIIGITLETRPDQIKIKEIKRMRLLGATRVEIGVQSIDDKVLYKVKRGHKVAQTIKATQLLKDAGFKVCYHLMPNLPGSNLQKDWQMFKEIFSNSQYMPDMIKIYPCVVTYQAKLFLWYQKKKFKPYSDNQLIDLLIKIKKIVPRWVRIMRLGRDIPIKNIAAGTKISNIREVLKIKFSQCQCIRCREIRSQNFNPQLLNYSITKYLASGGEEYFLEYLDKNNRLYSMLRLRLPKLKNHFIKVLQDAAIIRELHTYGLSLPINKKNSKAVQDEGLGKKLMKRAEKIALDKGYKKIAVIAGIGTRKYYRNLGFLNCATYMVKKLFAIH